MKKSLFILAVAAIVALFSSCNKEEVGGTAVQDLAGQWMVYADIVDDNGEVVVEDFNEGAFMILTYNNNADDPNILYINDLENFWDFIIQVPCDTKALTFGSDEYIANESYECGVKVTDGMVLKGEATTPSGSKADYIQFDVVFDDDDAGVSFEMPELEGMTIAEAMGGTKYRFWGWRYTGLAADE